jgi:hypothetical protein
MPKQNPSLTNNFYLTARGGNAQGVCIGTKGKKGGLTVELIARKGETWSAPLKIVCSMGDDGEPRVEIDLSRWRAGQISRLFLTENEIPTDQS